MMARTEQELRLADQRARQAATTELSRPVVLQAGAGTGKTAVLVNRVLTWALGGGWERAVRDLGLGHVADRQATRQRVARRVLERIVAVTFTERAAAEMEQRVADGLQLVAGGTLRDGALSLGPSVPEEAACRSRAAMLLDQIDHFAVSTIHGFCRRVLARFALEAGLHPGFVVDAGGAAAQRAVAETLWHRSQRAYGEPGDPRYAELAASHIGPPELGEALQFLVQAGVPADVLASDPYAVARIAALVAGLQGVGGELLACIGPRLDDGPKPGRVRAALEARKQLAALLEPIASDGLSLTVEEVIAITSAEQTDVLCRRLEAWSRSDGFTQTEGEAFGQAGTRIAELSRLLHRRLRAIQRFSPRLLPLLYEVLHELLVDARSLLRARGAVGFSELLERTHQLLRTRPDVVRELRATIDQLLVDESQDTDPVQAAIVRILALEGDPYDRPGFFLVGDPKQSIYGWREADLGAYEQLVERVREEGGAVHPLSVNYRSTAAVLDEVERVIAPSMSAEPGVQPPFEPLVAADPMPAGDVAVEHWVLPATVRAEGEEAANAEGASLRADQARALEARALVEDLRRARSSGALESWRSAAVLLRTTSAQLTYLEALRSAGIPYTADREPSYLEQREVIDAAAGLRAVIDPNDHVALVALLRSPRVGLPDAALLPLWAEGFPAAMSELRVPSSAALDRIDRLVAKAVCRVPAQVPGIERVSGWPTLLTAAVRSIAELRLSLQRDPADVFVDRLRSLLGGDLLEGARELGRHRLAHLERFYREVTEALAASPDGMQEVLRRLRRGSLLDREAQDSPAQAETADAVRVMTIHKAKGLSFDVVYVLGLDAGRRSAGSGAAFDGGRLGDSWELQLLGMPSAGFHELQQRRERIDVAEAVRTLYVAMTRPRRRLVLSGRWMSSGRGAARGAGPSHLDLVKSRAGDRADFDQLLREAESGRCWPEAVDANGVRWVVPTPSLPADLGRPTASAMVDGGLASAIGEAREAMKARAQAAERMSRPYLTAVTALVDERERGSSPVVRHEAGVTDSAVGSRVSRAVGTIIHRVLERLDLAADLVAGVDLAIDRVEQLLRAVVMPSDPAFAAALVATRQGIERLRTSQLLARLAELAPTVLGREVPLLVAGEVIGAEALGATVGTIDLLYRDPRDNQLVIADYKTDRIEDAVSLRERVAHHAPQLRAYRRALATAFALSAEPRAELWLLDCDRIEVVA